MKILIPFAIGDAQLVSSNVVETLEEYDAEATYAENDEVRDEATHTAWRSLVDGNTGNPLVDGANWLALGPTKRWGMFDEVIGTFTDNPEYIETVVSCPGRVTGIALLALEATSIELWIEDAVDGEVYHGEFDLNSYANVNNFWDYFFAPLLRKHDIFIDGLPLYAGAEVRLRINNPGGMARCGNADFGEVVTLGGTEWGMGFGLIDYSKKEANVQFGTVTLIERSYRSTAEFKVEIDPIYTDYVKRLLADRRATPTVYIGSGRYEAALIKGFYRSMRIDSTHRVFDLLTIELESLT